MQCIGFTFLFLKKEEINFSRNKYYFVLANTINFPQKTSNTVTVPSEHQDHSTQNTTRYTHFLNTFKNLVLSIAFITDKNYETCVSTDESLRQPSRKQIPHTFYTIPFFFWQAKYFPRDHFSFFT